MRLDAELRDFIYATWSDATERRAVVELLQTLSEAQRGSMVIAREFGSPESVAIADTVLVVTRDAIGLGWPMPDHRVLWRRSST